MEKYQENNNKNKDKYEEATKISKGKGCNDFILEVI